MKRKKMNDTNTTNSMEKDRTHEHGHTIQVGRPPLDRTEKANAIIHFKVTPSWRDMIQQDAASQNMRISEYLRDLTLRRHMELNN